MPDYKAMYFELFRASVQAVQLLQDAQAHAEQQLLAEDPPPLRLEPEELPPSKREPEPSPLGEGFFSSSLPPPWPQTCRCGSQSARGCRRPPGLFRRAGSL